MAIIAIETIVAIIRGSQPPRTSGGLAKASCVLGSCGGARDALYNAIESLLLGATIRQTVSALIMFRMSYTAPHRLAEADRWFALSHVGVRVHGRLTPSPLDCAHPTQVIAVASGTGRR
jgi:hypothetical protein